MDAELRLTVSIVNNLECFTQYKIERKRICPLFAELERTSVVGLLRLHLTLSQLPVLSGAEEEVDMHGFPAL